MSASSPLAIAPNVGDASEAWSFRKSPAANSPFSAVLANVLAEGVRIVEGIEGVSLELALDLRRLRPLRTRLMRFAVVLEPEEPSLSLSPEVDEASEELDEFSMSARTPGWDSSSMTCCGVL